MKKSDLSGEENTNSNRLSWSQLDEMNNEDKESLINEFGCILIFDGRNMEIYKIERVEL